MTTVSRRQAIATLTLGGVAAALAPAAMAAGHAKDHAVAIEGFAFAPGDLTISVGDSVEFTNSDSAPHTATADDGSFDTGMLRGGDQAKITFDTAGEFEYFCAVHPHMRAKITVEG
ncbi:cupredoxin domain-containing protein [Shimia ponticola]|uniref:cupredoxin domain-containing protein n=1 Tax=Shimia ponticola TaxID=2582893 RepID=UPI0011BE23AC|nr:cupredoxin family copper-binding protein [Shimia ponticola]